VPGFLDGLLVWWLGVIFSRSISIMNYTRRKFISKSVGGTALLAGGLGSVLASGRSETHSLHGHPFQKHQEFNVNVFSKMLHWLNYDELGRFAAEVGFDGVDLTVRPKGHVTPERVAEDLPKAVAAIRKAGLKVEMITTAITRADEPNVEAILKTASGLGIKHYRMGWINYDPKITIPDNIEQITKQLRALAELNGKYKMIAEYQNHSGANFGSPVWDLYNVLQKLKSPWLGSQYDVYHATVEAFNAWVLGLELLKPFIRSIDIKDFVWGVRDGKQARRDVPLGSGNVNLGKFFETLKAAGITAPISLHVEYDLGGAEQGATETSMPREKIMELMKADLAVLRRFLV
jgi:L-ribulose-5-phosphate 3-epimerase